MMILKYMIIPRGINHHNKKWAVVIFIDDYMCN